MSVSTNTYQADIEAWRTHMEESLRAEDSWLALAGLFWLHEGANSVGTDPSSDIELPAGSAPALIGYFMFQDSQVTFQAAEGVPVLINGGPVTPERLHSDMEGNKPDLVTLGSLTMFVIKRGDRYGIRLRDANSPARRDFTGRRWFPVQEDYCVTARFVPYDPPKLIAITDIIGNTTSEPSPGAVHFMLQGQELSLDASPTASGKLFFVFRDRTAGHETYGAGRFLYTDPPQNGQVTLDFNRAYSPPCAFTPYATCPLPAPQNHLPIRVEVGELFSGHGEHD